MLVGNQVGRVDDKKENVVLIVILLVLLIDNVLVVEEIKANQILITVINKKDDEILENCKHFYELRVEVNFVANQVVFNFIVTVLYY